MDEGVNEIVVRDHVTPMRMIGSSKQNLNIHNHHRDDMLDEADLDGKTMSFSELQIED